MEGDARVATVVVERYGGLWPGETCDDPGATETLEDTYWKLTRLPDEPVRLVIGAPIPREEIDKLVADGVTAKDITLKMAADLGAAGLLSLKLLDAFPGVAGLWRDECAQQITRWFTEGFDTPDLQEAKALIEALA
mgnify:CR=1 FL=1